MQDNDDGIFMVMTSNDISKLPPELMRSGRLDTQWFFGLPDSDDRVSILDIYFNKYNKTVSDEVMEYAVKKTEHFTGAEIKQMVSVMLRKLYNRYIKNNTIDKNSFTKEDVDNAVEEIIPVYNSNKAVVLGLERYAKDRARFASSKHTSSLDTNSLKLDIDINSLV